MKKLLIILVVLINTNCSKAQSTSSIDFIGEMDQTELYTLTTGSLGLVYGSDGYFPDVVVKGKEDNPYGDISLYMIHKDGGQEWVKKEMLNPKYSCPNRINGDCDNNNVRIACARLLVEDKSKLIDFAKWVFFIDKKYLVPFTEQGDTGMVTTYNTKDNSLFEVIVYQQLPGETVWTELERRTVNDDELSEWESDFIKSKEQKYN